MKRTVISFFLIALVGIVMNPLVSFAQEEDLLLAINDDESLSEEERFEKAKGGLERALSLALEKVARLATDLNNRQFDEETVETQLRAVSLEDLAQYEVYESAYIHKASYKPHQVED